jgi:hypothetical protein
MPALLLVNPGFHSMRSLHNHTTFATAPHRSPVKRLASALAFILISAGAFSQTPAASNTSNAGEVEFMRGVGFAQTPGQTPRTLGKGLALKEGDRLTTADGATAVVKLQDGTRMTVRPGSEMVLSQFKYKQDASDNSMVINMLRGGLRAITGLISKASPNAARIQTSTATIGIRGTDFDARLCSRDCGVEASRITQQAKPNAIQASAKVLASRGEVMALDGAGVRRRLVDGGGVYPGDVIETGTGTQAILAFRDESRVTVGAASRYRIDSYVFDSKNAGEGRMLTSLLKGTVRALSGLIAKASNKNVAYSTSTATIGIRGTELLIRCTGVCAGESPASASDGLAVYAYSGLVEVAPTASTSITQTLTLSPMAGVFSDANVVRLLNAEPANDLTAPGDLPIAPSFFNSGALDENQEGLYVFVRDGHIEITTSTSVLHLGHNEAGFAGENGNAVRPITIPRFIEFDRTPLPNTPNLNVISLLGGSDIPSGLICR